ncbi:MAG TPA: DUF5615 family PIN-like protein [Saprospiraceae bacterium]|nr:DUF5615 family PIN-like protein [Saprospiraceae bacterium]HMP14773.1 DUF5615 family PIN-like protein [Saprospiraceae bacterium]
MRFLADENLNNHIYRSLLLQRQDLDIVRVQDVGLYGKSDSEVLTWALLENRILITHDVRTIPALALEWLDDNRTIPGILLAEQSAPIGQIIADLLLIMDASEQSEWDGQIHYLPL